MSMEDDAERIAEEAYRYYANEWRKHQNGYPGGTMAFMAAYVDKSIEEAARKLNISGGATVWAQEKFARKLQDFNG
jgi:hypothetical protein